MARQSANDRNLNEEDRRFLREHGDDLSDTITERARWIHSPDEHEEHAGQSLVTRSHEVIRAWAEARGATPATVPGTEHDDRAGVLRFDFPDYGGDDLQSIDWDAWFEPFDDRDLVFLFQEHKSDGSTSNFFRLDNPRQSGA